MKTNLYIYLMNERKITIYFQIYFNVRTRNLMTERQKRKLAFVILLRSTDVQLL